MSGWGTKTAGVRSVIAVRAWLGIAAAMLGAAVTFPASATAAAIDQTCVLALTKNDPSILNAFYPDEAANYWAGTYQAIPGTRLRITGRYPHARYSSFNVYDNSLRPLDAVADFEFAPDPGSSNPFRLGADRNAEPRDYTGFIEFTAPPAQPAPNTLYAGSGRDGAANYEGTLLYRVYMPDGGLDDTGGVGLPTVTLESVSGTQRPPRSVCEALSKPTTDAGVQANANADGLPVTKPANTFTAPVPGYVYAPHSNPPVWNRAIGTENAGALATSDNSYLAARTSRAYGRVLEIRVKLPTFPDTRSGIDVMPTSELRYLSLCQNDVATRYVACRSDDRTVLDHDRFATYVISSPGDRPANARSECGRTWLPWGVVDDGYLLLRHMLPDPSFTGSIQASTPGPAEAKMGDYFPSARYYADGAAYTALGCRVTVANLPPVASFDQSPQEPSPGQEVTFSSTASDPDGQIVAQAWDLDDDGEFDDGGGTLATRRFTRPGLYTVRLRVVDDDGASDVAVRQVTVTAGSARQRDQ